MAEKKSIVFKVLGVAAGLVFIVFGFMERSSITRVKSLGQSAIVNPIEGYTVHKSKGSTTYMSQFTFKTEKGREITVKKSFPEELIKDFESNTPVKVFYDPKDPTEIVFEKEQPSWFLVGMGAVVAIAAVIFG